MVEIRGLEAGMPDGEDPVIALALPSFSLGGLTRESGQPNAEILEVERLAREAIRHALENEKMVGDFAGSSVTLVTPSDLHSAMESASDGSAFFAPNLCKELAQHVRVQIMVNSSGDPRSEGLAIQASWAIELFETPTLYVSDLAEDKLGTWIRDYIRRDGIRYEQARGDIEIARAIRLFISDHVELLSEGSVDFVK